MAAAKTASFVRYAPEDPTLPKPWRGLIDGKTGNLYFWNPETNVTQYERPASSSPAGPASPQKSLCSSTDVKETSERQVFDGSSNDTDNGCNRGGNAGPAELDAGVGYQDATFGSDYPRDNQNVTMGDGVVKEKRSSSSIDLSPEAYCRQHEITVSGNNVPPPLTSFDRTGFPYELLREVRSAGFSAPTPIQAQSWPVALQGRDIVAIAKTGSGKTLGYLIPGFIHLKRRQNNPRMGPTVLVLSPTRELATQIQDEAIKFGKSSKISCTCLYGGAPKGPQLKDLDRGVDIVVATPGRLNDILEMRRVSLFQVSYLVLDEADRMLDMGFEPQIRKIVKEVPSKRQTLMYTATWPNQVRRIAADLLADPVQVNIGNVDELVANKSITQRVELIQPREKRKRLEQILRSEEPGSKIIIFCSTKRMCDQLARDLEQQFGAAAIHGDKCQSERDSVLSQFRSGRSPVLVATDVAARGLDVKDIRVVINYDFPTGIEDYVHRIGRTGRAGATGVAYTFFGENDSKHASDLVKILEGANQKVPAEIRDMALRGGGGGGGMGRYRRQGGSEYSGYGGGRDDSDFNGRDAREASWTSSHGYDMDSGGRYGGSSQGEEAPGSYARSFHETMMRAAEKTNPSPSQSFIKGSSWSDNYGRERSRSPSAERSDQAPAVNGLPVGRSFHEMMMQKARAP